MESNEQEFVQLDGLVVIKVIKHCREHRPQLVTGQLVGLDLENTLEVTNSFPFQSKVSEDEDEDVEKIASEGAEYQAKMLRCFQEVNIDHNIVGWYSSNYMGQFFNEMTIATQYSYQERAPKSIVLVYDPIKTSQGSLSLKAYRLSEAFMNLYKTQSFSKESLVKANVSFNDIYEEIPILIHNALLVNAFLLELEESGNMDCDFERFNLSTNPFLEKNLESLIESLDDLGAEQTKLQYWQKNLQRQQAKRRDDPNWKQMTEPSRLDSLLLTNQINSYCRQIKQFSGSSFAKLWLVGGVQKDNN